MIRRAASLFSAAAAILLLSTAANAGPRAFVASTGTDANVSSGCGATFPCRSFAAAHAVVDAGGEIIALDSAGYGALTITKSVTIIANPGVYAGIAASTGSAIEIMVPAIHVKLRGLSLKGVGATYGITAWGTNATLSVENCVIANFPSAGVQVLHGSLRVIDSLFQNNGMGIQVMNNANASVAGTRFFGHTSHGIMVEATVPSTVSAVVTDSVSSHNAGSGIHINAQGDGINAFATVTRTTTAYNNAGMVAFATTGVATMVLDNNLSTRNTTGVQVSGAAVVESAGNNTVRLNTTDVVGTMTPMGTL